LETGTKQFFDHLTRTLSLNENFNSFYIKASSSNKKKLLSILFPEKLVFEDGAYRTHPENLFISAIINNINGFERGK